MTDPNHTAALLSEAFRFAQEQRFVQFQQALLSPKYGGTGPGVNALGEIAASVAIGGVGSVAVVTT